MSAQIIHTIWIWIAAFFTLAIFSFLYKDNPFYRIAEHIFVGVSAAYGLIITYYNAFLPYVYTPLIKGDFIVIIPVLIGLLFFARFIPKISWLVRIPIVVAMGWGAGVGLPRTFQQNIFEQLKASILTVNSFPNVWQGIFNIIMFAGIILTLSYFFFSRKENNKVFNTTSKIGTIFIMVSFGATFGYTVMARVSLLIGRILFLLRDWLGIIH